MVQYEGSSLQRALAKVGADPSQQFRESKLGIAYSAKAGGGVSRQPASEIIRVREEIARQAREKAAKIQESKRQAYLKQSQAAEQKKIQKAARQRTFEATQRYQRDISTIRTPTERAERVQQYKEELGEIRGTYQAERIEKGIVSAFILPSGERVTTKDIKYKAPVISKPEYVKGKRVSFKEDVLGVSGAYYILPYTGQVIGDILRKIPAVERLHQKYKLDRPAPAWLESAAMTLPVTSFFGPALATTAEIEIGLSATAPTLVKFKGTEQRFEKDLIKTDIKFQTSAGERGVARGITKQLSQTTDDAAQLSRTVSGGEIYGRPTVEFPTGRIKIPSRQFVGQQKGITSPTDISISISDDIMKASTDIEGFSTIGTGRIATSAGKDLFVKTIKLPSPKPTTTFAKGTSLKRFLSKSFGATIDDTTYLAGASVTEAKDATIAIGAIKRAAIDAGMRDLISTGGRTISPVAVQDTASIIQAAVKSSAVTSPQISTAGLISSAALSSTDLAKDYKFAVSGLEARQIASDIVKQTSIPSLAVSELSGQKYRQKTKLQTKLKTKQEERLKSRQVTLQRQEQRQFQRQMQRLQLQTRQRGRGRGTGIGLAFATPVTPKIPLIPFIPFTFKGLTTPYPRRKRKYREDELYISGFTAKTLGIEKEISEKDLRKLSKAIDIRPIPIIKRKRKKK